MKIKTFTLRDLLRRTSFLIILAMGAESSNVMAGWTLVDVNDDSSVFSDLSTIRKDGNLVKMWVLYDFQKVKQLAGVNSQSYKALYQFNCQEEMARTVGLFYYSKHMGSGNISFSNSDISEWRLVIPDTVGHRLWSDACNKSWRNN